MIKGFDKVLKRIDSLPRESQVEVLNSLKDTLKGVEKRLEDDKNKELCSIEGHKFNKWKHNCWTKYEDVVIDHMHIKDFPIKCENWERKCSRCGYVLRINNEPQEVIDAKKERSKARRIKRLEKQLEELKED